MRIKQVDSVFPLDDYVLIEVMKPPEKSSGGIHLPDVTKERQAEKYGIVRRVGPGRLLDNGSRVLPQVVAGDRVFCSWVGGASVKVGEEVYELMRESSIMARWVE